MNVERFENSLFTSNTYKITIANSNRVWLIDVGSFDIVQDSLLNEQYIEGVLLTHYHHDHIYCINELVNAYPACKVYASKHTIQGLFSSKMNLSFYHDNPIVYKGNKPFELIDGNKIIFFNDIIAEVIATPGHNPGSLTYKLENYLFTGDSYVPGFDVVTKLKYGNRVDSLQSLDKLESLFEAKSIICPGHGQIVNAKETLSHLQNLQK